MNSCLQPPLNEGYNTIIYAIQCTVTLEMKKEKLSQRFIPLFSLANMYVIY